MYYRGDGVPQDYVKAQLRFNLAGTVGETQATENRDMVALLMTPVEIGTAQKLAREWKPTE